MPASEAPPTPDDATVLAHPARSERPSRSGADDSDPIIGVVLGGTFRVLSVLGEGAMGVVYEAQHLRLDRRFAVKLIHHTIAGREDLLQRFDREARAMSRVRSDHVVDVADVVRTPDGRPCIVTEKLEGEDLERHLGSRGGKVQVSVAVPLLVQYSTEHALDLSPLRTIASVTLPCPSRQTRFACAHCTRVSPRASSNALPSRSRMVARRRPASSSALLPRAAFIPAFTK